jgi:hypothetical protein
VKDDSQRVLAGFQFFLCRNPPGAEHVVRFEEFGFVQIDIGVGVESRELQVNVLARERCGIDVEFGLVLPIREADPLQGLFVVAIKRILNQLVVQKIHLHHSGNFGRMPLLHSRMAFVVQCSETPAGVNKNRGGRQCKNGEGE